MNPAAATKLLTGTKVAGRFKDVMPLLMSSMPGALFSGGFATLTTGNPLAGLTVAGADLLGSTALASGIGALGGKTGTRKILGKDVRLAGGRVTKLRPDEVIPKEAMKNKESFEKFMQSRTSFEPSPAQTIGQVSGSIGAVLAVEPMFYPQPQSGITDQQLFQRYATSSFMPNPEYLQRHYSDPDLQNPGQVGSITSLSPGTLYQTTNIPSNLMGVM
tara:strand:- start:79 stop:729 length:651 start_codon:yes stop_codon:yes gene_type:complete